MSEPDWLRHEEPEKNAVEEALDAFYGELKGVEDNQTKPKKRGRMDHPRKGPPKGQLAPAVKFARSLGDYRVTSEVAEILGMSESWVRKVSKDRVTQAPSKVAPYGNNHIYLYTPEDIEALRAYIEDQQTVMTIDEFESQEE